MVADAGRRLRTPRRWTRWRPGAPALIQAQEDFKLKHLAELLVRHERYCTGPYQGELPLLKLDVPIARAPLANI